MKNFRLSREASIFIAFLVLLTFLFISYRHSFLGYFVKSTFVQVTLFNLVLLIFVLTVLLLFYVFLRKDEM